MSNVKIPAHLTSVLNTYASQRGLDLGSAVERLLAIGLENDTSTPTGDLVSAIRDACNKLARGHGEWVQLAEIRVELAGAPREAVDAALMQMMRNREITSIPEENQKALRRADHAAAILAGREYRHLIALEY